MPPVLGGLTSIQARQLLGYLAPHIWSTNFANYPTAQVAAGPNVIDYAPPVKNSSPGYTGLDIASLLGFTGLPQSLIDQINSILSQGYDPATAQQLAYNTILSSGWFATNYPGYSKGVASGMFSSPADYRTYLNQLNNLQNQWTGFQLTGEQMQEAIDKGYTPAQYAKILEGAAWTQTYTPDVQTAFGAYDPYGQLGGNELTKLGQQEVGYGSNLGYALDKRLKDAQQRMARIFQGVAAAPSLVGKSAGTGISAPSLSGGQGGVPDVEGYALKGQQGSIGTFGGL